MKIPSLRVCSSAALLFFSLFIMPVSGQIVYEDLHLVPGYAKSHGVLMGLAFAVMMPLGIIMIRIPHNKPYAVYIHAGWQLASWILMIAGLVFGLRVGKILDRLHNNPHTILGTVVVALLFLQPFFGLAHHLRFRKKHKRGVWTLIHVWYGRLLILLGIINGGFGLKLAANTTGGEIAYGIFAGIFGVAMIYTAVTVEMKLRKPDPEAVVNSS